MYVQRPLNQVFVQHIIYHIHFTVVAFIEIIQIQAKAGKKKRQDKIKQDKTRENNNSQTKIGKTKLQDTLKIIKACKTKRNNER